MLIAGLCLASLLVQAREYSDVQCTAEKCGFKDSLGEGPTRMRDWVTGYCVKCQKFVSRNWNRDGGQPKPPTLLSVWDPETGKTRELFSCPTCEQWVMVIHDRTELKHCPKCASDKVFISQPNMFKD